MTIVHVFWDEGTVSSYTFDSMRAVYAFLDEIGAHKENELVTGNIVCNADGKRAGRNRARVIARQLGASRLVVREVTNAGPP
jgi:hypothetical protein